MLEKVKELLFGKSQKIKKQIDIKLDQIPFCYLEKCIIICKAFGKATDEKSQFENDMLIIKTYRSGSMAEVFRRTSDGRALVLSVSIDFSGPYVYIPGEWERYLRTELYPSAQKKLLRMVELEAIKPIQV